jgi:hypothetical protein
VRSIGAVHQWRKDPLAAIIPCYINLVVLEPRVNQSCRLCCALGVRLGTKNFRVFDRIAYSKAKETGRITSDRVKESHGSARSSARKAWALWAPLLPIPHETTA